MNFGKRISELRKSENLTITELADMLELTRPHLSAIENGRKKPSLDLIERICEIFKISLSEFFNDDENVQSDPELIKLIQNAKTLHPELLSNINGMISTLKKNYRMVKTTIEGKDIEYVVDLNVKPNGLTKEEEMEAYQLLQRLKELEGK